MIPDELLGLLADLGEERKGYPATPADMPWTCEPCGFVLGLVAKADGILRRKTSDGPMYFTLGKGGRVVISCPRCAAVCTLKEDEISFERSR